MNATPLLDFSGNQAYGAILRGFTTWWLGAFFETPKGIAGTLKNSLVWHAFDAAYFTYETNKLTIDGFVVRGDPDDLKNNGYTHTTGLAFGDYMTRDAVVINADVQNVRRGIGVPVHVGRNMSAGTFTVRNSYLSTMDNIEVPLLLSNNGSAGLSDRTVIIENVVFSHPSYLNPNSCWNIYMDQTAGDPNYYKLDATLITKVYDYDGVDGIDYQVYYNNNHPNNAYTMPDVFGFVLPI